MLEKHVHILKGLWSAFLNMYIHALFSFQVLSLDIRPVHRRIQSPLWSDPPLTDREIYPGTEHLVGLYHVVLENVDISYDIMQDQNSRKLGSSIVTICGAMPNVVQSQQRGLGVLKMPS